MSSREQFESWYLDNWGHTEDHHETLFERSPDDESEYYRLGVRMAHQAWQAATSAMEAKCAALVAELKQSQIDAGCYKKGMEASNERLVQVAAENAGLKESTVNHAPAVENWNAWADAEDKIPAVPETPATDAFLAEVRASAVDEACLKISNAIINCYQDEQVGLDAAATICGDFAAKLRQEAAQ